MFASIPPPDIAGWTRWVGTRWSPARRGSRSLNKLKDLPATRVTELGRE